MITTNTQIKPKHIYLYAYIPIYFYLVNPVNPVKKMISCIYPKDRYNASFRGDQK